MKRSEQSFDDLFAWGAAEAEAEVAQEQTAHSAESLDPLENQSPVLSASPESTGELPPEIVVEIEEADADEPEEPSAAEVIALPKVLGPHEMRQAALGFLASQNPAGVAGYVPARFRKYQVAAAAFWTRDFGRIRQVVRTAIVEIYDRRDRCFADCAERAALLESIHELRDRREELEAQIRRNEPHLADSDDLFSELRTWHYERSTDPEYGKLRRKLDKLQHSLYHGSRLERIRRAGVADVLYLAVPAGVLAADEIASGWGLLYIYPDGSVEVVAEPDVQLCDMAARTHLALNIAQAAMQSVLFTAGVGVSVGGEVKYYRPPRRRLKRTMF